MHTRQTPSGRRRVVLTLALVSTFRTPAAQTSKRRARVALVTLTSLAQAEPWQHALKQGMAERGSEGRREHRVHLYEREWRTQSDRSSTTRGP
jgi:hypothetical protein